MKKLLNAITNIVEKRAKSMLGDLLQSKKDVIIAKINKKLDIPLLSEKDEAELIEGIWETVEEAILEIKK